MPISKVADKLAIQDMLFRYCRGLDRMDKALALSVFHPDSQLDYGDSFKGSGPEFVDWVWEQHRKAVRHSHNITNLYVEVDGDRAASEAYSLMSMLIETPNGTLMLQNQGRYLDEWVRYEGRWVIVKRCSVHEFRDMRPLTDSSAAAALSVSRRGAADPSYSLSPRLTFS